MFVTMEAYIKHWREKTDARKLIVSTRDGTFGVPVAAITYIECTAAKQQLFVSTQKEPIAISSRMQKLEEELKNDGFIRIHKGYLVNHRWIDRITNDSVVLQNGATLPVSRLKKQGATVRVVLTANACRFVPPLTFETLSGNPASIDTFHPRKELEHIARELEVRDTGRELFSPNPAGGYRYSLLNIVRG